MAIGDYTRIATNIGAFNALNTLKHINRRIEGSQLPLATGRRINEVADDPSGFVLATRLQARYRGISAAIDNIGTARNVLSIAEGGLQNTLDILLRIKELVTQSLNETNGTSELVAIGSEISQLRAEIDNIVEETRFNDRQLLDGSYVNITFQTGPNAGNVLNFSLSQEHTTDALDLNPPGGPPPGIPPDKGKGKGPPERNEFGIPDLDKVNAALETVLDSLQHLGAVITRLSIKEENLRTSSLNIQATQSRILDADIAHTVLQLIRDLILQQTAMAQLAQSNILPQHVLVLFT